MKISLLVVGKTVHSYLNQGIDEYTKRISRYCPFSIQYIADAKTTKSLSQEQQKQLEGDNIAAALDKSDYVVLLDEHGKEFTSVDFSAYIERKMQSVPKRLVFIIGGPYGFSKEIYERANEKISLSKMTFPHDLIRLVFTEQLYRAFSIIHHEPYHHE
ncbi:MAG: 23S rRNA (pseudouridine(1915)-N(3))-methyltransferase RlmH [Bacteroidetes bacterium]|uniref:Ribosomal RNA large subunit methyltransferase H n=1 Tax=Candidatus Limisoma faecipullorum TaxID=2840854 RepID=A0A9D9IQG7_9BACT|nr:23S rRNA (pseudouridine(1915)-N(3))-methyltransferase RlmH [Candidatus Limisoma faecipullorum]